MNIRLINTGVSATEKDRVYGFVGGLAARTRPQAGRREGVEGAKGGQGGQGGLGAAGGLHPAWPIGANVQIVARRHAAPCLGVPGRATVPAQ